MKPTKSQEWILNYLKQNPGFNSPTAIGNAHAKIIRADPNSHHSSWASPICKRLVKKGLVERSEKGHYKIKQ